MQRKEFTDAKVSHEMDALPAPSSLLHTDEFPAGPVTMAWLAREEATSGDLHNDLSLPRLRFIQHTGKWDRRVVPALQILKFSLSAAIVSQSEV